MSLLTTTWRRYVRPARRPGTTPQEAEARRLVDRIVTLSQELTDFVAQQEKGLQQ